MPNFTAASPFTVCLLADMLPLVFVTGNANKLKEVKAILAAGTSGIEVTSQSVEGGFYVAGVYGSSSLRDWEQYPRYRARRKKSQLQNAEQPPNR